MRDERGGGDEVNRVTQRRLVANLAEQVLRVLRHLHVLLLASNVENQAKLPLRVRLSGDDEQAVEQVDRDAVRGLVVGAADLGDAPVRGHHQHRRHVVLQRSVKKREALDVQHVNLVDEEHAGDDVRLAFLSPLGNLHVDLLANLRADLAGVTREEREETLRPGVNHVDLVKGHDVDNFFSLLQLALGALHKLGLRPHRVVVPGPREAAA